MPDLTCPYSATFSQKDNFACPNADEVIRRGGSEYICLKLSQYDVCSQVLKTVKQKYLESQGLEDDLLSVPHSTFVKIQFGCALELQSSLDRDTSNIEDLGRLIADAIERFGAVETLPFELLNNKISSFKLKRRGMRG